MRILSINSLKGPNAFTGQPVLCVELDLEDLAASNSAGVEGFTADLLAMIPGLALPTSSGGLVQRLREGLCFGELVEPVAVELSRLAGVAVGFMQSNRTTRHAVYEVVVEYEQEHVSRCLLAASVQLIDALAAARPFDVAARVVEIAELARDQRHQPGLNATIEAAERAGVPCTRIGSDGLLMLGHGRRRRFADATATFLPHAGGDLSAERAREIAATLVESLFPAGAPARIPIVSIAGWQGKTSVARMITHALDGSGHVVGSASSDGLFVGHELLVSGQATDAESARALLADANVDVVVLETSDDGIERSGLGYDWADVAVLTNVSNASSVDASDPGELLRLKSVVASRVRDGGTLVLNADDPHLARLGRFCGPGKRVVLFSLFPQSTAVLEHAQSGQTAYVLDNGVLTEIEGGAATPLVRADDLPVTVRGTSSPDIANALASLAASRALGLSQAAAVRALTSFDRHAHREPVPAACEHLVPAISTQWPRSSVKLAG